MTTAIETARIGDWMQTAYGRAYWPRDPRPSEVFIDDIALTLSNQCRYGGQMPRRKWYSVAQHCVLVSEVVQLVVMKDPSLSPHSWRVTSALALMHDWAEAYLVDVPRPAKKALRDYDALEQLNFDAIRRRFGMPMDPLPACIWDADERVLFTERRDLLAPPPMPWVNEGMIAPLPRVITPLPSMLAEVRFLKRAKELGIKEIAA